ncbi:MAG: HemK/PrmC family methyltransferase [Candidatus Andersenbacteria bacterium]
MVTVKQIRERITIALQDISDAPSLDAEFILRATLPAVLFPLPAHLDDELEVALLSKIQHMINERKTGKPLAYVLGEWDFYGRPFTVNPNVLIPRPATENLVAKTLDYIVQTCQQAERSLVVADVATGSGCVATTLLLEHPTLISHMYATDISLRALEVAKHNAEKYAVDSKITFLHGNMLDPLENVTIDLVVSNPPYVPSPELQQPPNANTRGLQFEPQIALDGGPLGTTFTDTLLASSLPVIYEGLNGEILSHNIPAP